MQSHSLGGSSGSGFGSSGFGSMNPWAGMAGGMLGGGLGSLFGDLFGNYKNPADASSPYYDQAQSALEKYLMPYIQNGQNMSGLLQGQYGSLLSDPGGMLNKIGQGYHQSPGYDFALKQALQSANQASAAGGMAGSPLSQQQNMGVATGLADQDYNKWMQNALGMYNQGLSGAQGMYGIGAQAGMGMGQDLASLLASRAQMAYEGQNAENQHEGGEWGSIFGGLGSLAGLAGWL